MRIIAHTDFSQTLATLATLGAEELTDVTMVAFNYGQPKLVDGLDIIGKLWGISIGQMQGQSSHESGKFPYLGAMLFPLAATNFAIAKGSSAVILDVVGGDAAQQLFGNVCGSVAALLSMQGQSSPEISAPLIGRSAAEVSALARDFLMAGCVEHLNGFDSFQPIKAVAEGIGFEKDESQTWKESIPELATAWADSILANASEA
jgi:hypothetical protein